MKAIQRHIKDSQCPLGLDLMFYLWQRGAVALLSVFFRSGICWQIIETP